MNGLNHFDKLREYSIVLTDVDSGGHVKVTAGIRVDTGALNSLFYNMNNVTFVDSDSTKPATFYMSYVCCID